MKKVILFISLGILTIFFLLFLAKLISPKEIDNVSPGISCEEGYLEKKLFYE